MSTFTDGLVSGSISRITDYDRKRRKHPTVEGRTMPELEDLAIGESRAFHLAVFSMDIRGFTDLSMKLDNPKINELARIQALYLSEMSAIIRDYSGVTEKYTGDGVMGLFGTESDTRAETDVKNALEAALTANLAIKRALNPYLESKNLPRIVCGIGVDHGPVLVERVGLKGGNQFSLAGPTVSLASKIQDHAPEGCVFIGNDAYKRAPKDFQAYCVPTTLDWKFKYPVYHFRCEWQE